MSSTITSTPDQTAPQQSISIQDLQNLLIIVDLATQRGAFRGQELSQVGSVFDKLNQFVQSVAQQQQPADGQPVAPPVSSTPQPMQMNPTPVTPMTPPFSPKTGV